MSKLIKIKDNSDKKLVTQVGIVNKKLKEAYALIEKVDNKPFRVAAKTIMASLVSLAYLGIKLKSRGKI